MPDQSLAMTEASTRTPIYVHVNHACQPLRIGIILDDLDVPAWIAETIEAIRRDLRFDVTVDPVAQFWADDLMVGRVQRVGQALQRGSKTECARAVEILDCLSAIPEAAHAVLMKCVMTEGARRKT